MPSSNIVNQKNSDKDIVILRPGRNDKIETTLKTYQTIYDHITGGKQKLSKEFFIDYEIGFPQLDQLNMKFEQLLKQYNIISKNCSVYIMHEDEDREIFNSYDNFSTYNISNIHPITVINVTYNFSILLPSSNEINNYTFNISITPGIIPPMELRKNYKRLRYVGATIKIEIDYMDYVVARTIIENISDWVKGVEIDTHQILEFISNQSEYIASFIRNGLSIVLVIVILFSNRKIVPDNATNNTLFISFVIIGAIFFFSYKIINHFCINLEFGLYLKDKRSLLNINEGDKKLKQKLKRQNNNNLLKNVVSFFMTLLTTFLSSILIKIIFEL